MREVSGVSAKILEEAVAGLAAVEAGEANLDDFLDFRLQYPELRRSISSLLFLCFRRKRFLEGWIGRLAARPPRPAVRRLLTAVLAQITFQTGIAPESAVNIAVGLVKHSGKLQEAKFVNAVLRRALEQPQPVPEAPELVLPPALFKRWRKRYSEAELAQLAAALLAQPEFTFRAERGFEPGELAAEAVPAFGEFRFFRACSAARLLESAALRDGRIYIQDPATSLAPSLPDFNGVKSVLDLCAAPGGKSLMLGERLAGEGRLVAADRSERRQRQTAENFRRRGLDYQVTVADPAELTGEFDVVLADVPCSNTGVYRRRPDVLWRFRPEELEKITALQRRILGEAARLTAPGGQLVYSTCSIEPEENPLQVEAFLKEHPGFERLCERQLLPSAEMDGAYACLLRRSASSI